MVIIAEEQSLCKAFLGCLNNVYQRLLEDFVVLRLKLFNLL